MRHVLIDDPQAVAAGGDDEALVDLAERAQIGEHGERHFGRRDGLGRKFAVRVEVARELAGRRRTGRHFERRRAEIQARRGAGGGAQGEFGQAGDAARRRPELRGSAGRAAAPAGSASTRLAHGRLVLDHLAEFGIGQPRGGLRGVAAARAGGENDGAGRLSISRSRMVSRTKSWTNEPWRKRTSVFDGCTLTSTSSASHSRNSSAKG